MQLSDIKERETGVDILTKFEKLLEEEDKVLKTKFCN